MVTLLCVFTKKNFKFIMIYKNFEERKMIMKTLVILVHPDMENSKANKRWKEELSKYPDEIEIHELYKEYPDWNINVKKEQELIEKYDHIIEYNWAYGPEGNKLKGKKMGLAVTTGGRKEYYTHGGENKFTLDELFIPFEAAINYAKAEYLPYFSIFAVSPHVKGPNEEETDKNAKEYVEHIQKTGNWQ